MHFLSGRCNHFFRVRLGNKASASTPQPNMYTYPRAALAGALMLALSACRTDVTKPWQTKVRIAVATPASLTSMPVVLAKELGFYTAEQLDVTLDDAPGGSKVLQSLLAGSVDVGSALDDQVVAMAAEGRDLKSFVLMLRAPGVALVALPGNPKRIRAIRDLKGGTVAVTSPGSPVHMHVNYLLAQNGLPADSVSIVGTPSNAARVTALEHSKVDAAILGEPGLAVLNKRHPQGITVLADLTIPAGVKSNFGSDVYPGSVLFAQTRWLRENPEAARRLARAVQRSLRWCHEHTAHEIAERMPPALRIEDRATYEQAIVNIIPILSKDGVMPADAAEAERNMLVRTSEAVRRASLDVRTTYTN